MVALRDGVSDADFTMTCVLNKKATIKRTTKHHFPIVFQ
jgi:hypothetical protein